MPVHCPELTDAPDGLCLHCRRKIERYLDETDWARLEANRLIYDMEGWADDDVE